jgi:hypothetical protein
MNLMHALHALLGNHQQQQHIAQQAAQAGGGMAQAVHAAPLSRMQYSGAPETQDQARAALAGPLQLHQSQGRGIPLQSQGMPNLGNTAGMGMQHSLQGGGFNPGLSPLQAQQSGGGGPRGVQPVAPAYGNNLTGIPQDLYNPQVQDNGYFWDSI